MVEISDKAVAMFSRTGQQWMTNQIYQLPLEKVSPDPDQPRKAFDQVKLEELAESMKARGLIQPITVTRPDKKGCVIIRHGERRWRAAKLAGFEKIGVVIDTNEDASSRGLDQYIENEQREGLTASEIVAFVKERIDTGMKANELATAIGKPKAAISKFAALGDAPDYIRDRLDAIGVNTAYVLLQCDKIDNDATRQRLDESDGMLTYRDAVALQSGLKAPAPVGGEQAPPPIAAPKPAAPSEPDTIQTASQQPDKTPPLPSAPSTPRSDEAEHKRDDIEPRKTTETVESKEPVQIVIDGRRARFVRGDVLFDGEQEPVFVDRSA